MGAEKTAGKQRGRPFKPGQSGNPAGKPPGCGAARLRALLDPHVPELVEKAVQLAKGGDTTALRICLERCIPTLKPVDDALSMPGIGTGTLEQRAQSILSALDVGSISPDHASAVIRSIATYSEILALSALEARIAKLEEKEPTACHTLNAESDSLKRSSSANAL